ncbi:hypothetical protein STEG23_029330, partial [Scotinomys teguina]
MSRLGWTQQWSSCSESTVVVDMISHVSKVGGCQGWGRLNNGVPAQSPPWSWTWSATSVKLEDVKAANDLTIGWSPWGARMRKCSQVYELSMPQ